MPDVELIPHDKMAEALVAALAELENPPRDAKATVPTKSGGQFSYTYASLPAIIDHVRPTLAKHGLAVTQEALTDGDFVGVRTTIHHTSGAVWVNGPLVLPMGGTAQNAGSAITYARRYALCAALGIASDEDDDGAAASKPPPKNKSAPAAKQESKPAERVDMKDAGATGADAAGQGSLDASEEAVAVDDSCPPGKHVYSKMPDGRMCCKYCGAPKP